jgi:hypothetical protein
MFQIPSFYIKPNDNGIKDWKWIITEVQRRINLWWNRSLSRGRPILVKFVLEAIPIYRHSLAFIPKGVLEKISFRFLWYQKKESEGIPLGKWKAIEILKTWEDGNLQITSICGGIGYQGPLETRNRCWIMKRGNHLETHLPSHCSRTTNEKTL